MKEKEVDTNGTQNTLTKTRQKNNYQGGIYMFGITPFERRDFDIFDPFNAFDDDFMSGARFAPCRTDIREEDDKYVMETELPGFCKEDIGINISDKILTITAKHETNEDQKDEKGKYIRRERSTSSYKRSFDLSGVDADKIDAQYTNGILTLNLPKKQPEAPTSRRLEVR